MSVDFYLVCESCRKRIHIAQDGLGGWSFYSGEPDCMAKLSQWLGDHAMAAGEHHFALHSEHATASEDYAEIEWRPGGAT
jgi:hypothetical protein